MKSSLFICFLFSIYTFCYSETSNNLAIKDVGDQIVKDVGDQIVKDVGDLVDKDAEDALAKLTRAIKDLDSIKTDLGSNLIDSIKSTLQKEFLESKDTINSTKYIHFTLLTNEKKPESDIDSIRIKIFSSHIYMVKLYKKDKTIYESSYQYGIFSEKKLNRFLDHITRSIVSSVESLNLSQHLSIELYKDAGRGFFIIPTDTSFVLTSKSKSIDIPIARTFTYRRTSIRLYTNFTLNTDKDEDPLNGYFQLDGRVDCKLIGFQLPKPKFTFLSKMAPYLILSKSPQQISGITDAYKFNEIAYHTSAQSKYGVDITLFSILREHCKFRVNAQVGKMQNAYVNISDTDTLFQKVEFTHISPYTRVVFFTDDIFSLDFRYHWEIIEIPEVTLDKREFRNSRMFNFTASMLRKKKADLFFRYEHRWDLGETKNIEDYTTSTFQLGTQVMIPSLSELAKKFERK